ncbi:MAG: HEAT repeat domain-containing protein [Planctomycetes bacterium]|nr:HEAT repeat domain-containing protein [Planctomycetota bacterium]
MRKALRPQGKVPAGIQGLTRKIQGGLQSERTKKWDAEEAQNISTWVSRSPAWALSVAFHFVAAVILMNVVYFTHSDRLGQVFRMTLRASAPGGAKQGDQDNGINGDKNEDQAPAGKPVEDAPPASSKGLPEKKDEKVISGGLPMKVDMGETSGQNGIGGIYAGRGGAGRGNALRQYGGDGVSEQAVMDGLEWLARHQGKNGAWDPERYDTNCPAGDSCNTDEKGSAGYIGATTGLALLAFLGAGYSHLDDHLRPQDEGGPVVHAYTATITKALKYLCREQERDGCVDPSGTRNMYTHGIAGLAIVEAYSMSHDAALRPHAQRAINFVVEAQQDSGGWNYTPDHMNRSDTSITSWAVMMLRSARAANLAVPKRTWDRAKRFMHNVTDYQTGNIGYCVQGPPTRTTPGCNAMIAIGMATRTYLGMPDDQSLSEKWIKELKAVPPRYDEYAGRCPNWGGLMNRKGHGHNSLYYTYYATLALFHHGGAPWDEWNKKMREATIPTQDKEGHAKGSWEPVVWDGAWGGRVYTTAFNVMNLEVYYRYLPCYQVGAEFGLAKLLEDGEWDKVLEDAQKGKFGEVSGTASETPEEPGKPVDAEAPRDKRPEPVKPARGVEDLIKDLKADDMMTRRNAAKDLSLRAEKTAIVPLIDAAKAEKTSLQPVLIEYLGNFGDEPAVLDYLIGVLENEDRPRHRTAAAAGLRRATGELTLGEEARAWKEWRQKHEKESGK